MVFIILGTIRIVLIFFIARSLAEFIILCAIITAHARTGLVAPGAQHPAAREFVRRHVEERLDVARDGDACERGSRDMSADGSQPHTYAHKSEEKIRIG